MYNLALFLFYSNVSIYLLSLLCGSHLVLIRCKVLLITNIRTKLPFVLYLSSIIIQTLHFLFTIKERTCLFHYFTKTFLYSTNPLPCHTLSHHLESHSTYLIPKYQYTILWLFRVFII